LSGPAYLIWGDVQYFSPGGGGAQQKDFTALRPWTSLRPSRTPPVRCYGTPGHARAQQLAGLALNDRERMRGPRRSFANP
jgi:hypothetical protein